jgi:serine/threonine protein kinase
MSKNHKKTMDDSFIKENTCIFKKYKPIKKIGKGCFGSIYSVIRIEDKSCFAMKTEKINLKKILESEAYYLFNLQGIGIPKLISFGHTKNYYILIETLLGKSLKEILKNCISITDICLIGLQIIDRLEWIHSKDLIYRDIKPDNFLFGMDDPNVLYIIDFGLCKKYRSSKTGKHILPKMTGKFNGNFHYCSQYVIKGKESSRRDDIISLGYLLIYLLKRELPWTNVVNKKVDRAKYYEIVYLKETDGCGSLFKNIPEDLAIFFKYSRKLKFEEESNYLYLRSLLNNILLNQNFNKKILSFSWIDSNNKKLLKMPKSLSKRKSNPYMRILKNIRNKKENLNESKINEKINTIPFTTRINNSLDLNIPDSKDNIALYCGY